MTSYVDPDDDPSPHRLEGSSGEEKGGLIIMRKDEKDKHVFKKPAVSLLGLDKLAEVKRKSANESSNVKKKSRVTSYKDEEDDGDSSSSSDDDDGDYKKSKKQERKDRLVTNRKKKKKNTRY